MGAVGLARFRAEAEAVAKLSHSNIVQIYETGEHEGRPFFSLELVEGGSLDQRIAESPTSPRAAAQLIETLARTMARCTRTRHHPSRPQTGEHSAGQAGQPVVDCEEPGSRFAFSTRGPLVEDHRSPRSPISASPSRWTTIRARPRAARSWARPVTWRPNRRGVRTGKSARAPTSIPWVRSCTSCWWAVRRSRPGNPIDTIRQVIEQEPVPPRQLEPRVPHDLETICLKCLEKDPARRFASAIELADDLQRFVDGEPIHARPTPAWERAWKWGKRRPAIVALLGVSALAVL